jgi:putative tryptophan/tyrosine transport system substrate-binding protein
MGTTRRDVLALGAAALLPALARAQQARKPLRLAWFSGGSIEDQRVYVDAFRGGMRELGYREGTDFEIQYFWRGDTIKPFSWMARDVAAAKPDMIMATCEVTVEAARKVTSSIPIVMTASTDPVASGVVSSLARPGGNVTGVSSTFLEVSVKRIELMKELLPAVDRIAFVRWKHERLSDTELSMVEKTAGRLGFTHRFFEAEDEADFARVFEAVQRERFGGVVDLAGLAVSFPFLDLIPQLAARYKVPVVHFIHELVERGGLMSFGPSVTDGFRRSARYVDRIAKGARPAELPIEQPDKVELWVNRAAARSLGIKVPESILLRADRVLA